MSDGLLAACKFLAMYEATQGAGTNWERHALGILKIVEVRGAVAHQTGLAHALFLDARYQGIAASIRRRVPTFLSSEEWCTIPFKIEGKDVRHELLDIMAEIPRLQTDLSCLGKISESAQGAVDRRASFFLLCRSIRRRLGEWLGHVRAKYDVDRVALIEEGIPENFPLSNITLAHTMSLYWTSMLLVNFQEFLGLRDVPVPTRSIPSKDYFDNAVTLEILPYILYIAKSVPYFFQPEAGSLSPQLFSFPLGVAVSVAADTNAHFVPEYRRLLKAFSKGVAGEQIRKFLTSLQLLADSGDKGQSSSFHP
ncbi:uncharacterized protein PV09_07513 [Verruconis gallopava]|uniref:Transcription factor domain-containing protein n=1 Tax=Verruconis gallopava TaxID=253628 RepID=A0A0D2APE8_9PEZI|nr:uncharacterized protein PV09_07513 [Verruconis gallopava]KIW00994.1 hypothetical protein PV09_07513 [Verruconis gallopava]